MEVILRFNQSRVPSAFFHINPTIALKSRLVGSPFEPMFKRLRWIAGRSDRKRHPELWEIWSEEIRLPQILERFLKPRSRFIDIGAHVGSFLSLVMRFAPNGGHIAIEPSPTRGALLKKRFPSVTVIAVAISDRDGSAKFFEDPRQPGFSHLEANISNKEAFCCDVITSRIDSLDLPDKIDLIKLDIEGGELAALRGGENLLLRDRPIVIFEGGTEYQGLDRKGLFQFFIDRNYDVFTFGDFLFEKGPLTYDEFRKCGLYPFRGGNYLALPRCAGTGS